MPIHVLNKYRKRILTIKGLLDDPKGWLDRIRQILKRHEEGQLGPQLPTWRTSWANDIVMAGYICVHRLVAESDDSTEAAANRYRPLLPGCRQPV